MQSKSLMWIPVAISLMMMAACSGEQSPTPEGEKRKDVPFGNSSMGRLKPVLQKSDIVLPIDVYVETPKQAHLNDSAVARVVQDCMQKAGFRWPYLESQIDASQPMNGGRYGVLDMKTARTWGYHPPFSDESASDRGDAEADLTPEEREAYMGVSAKTGKPLSSKRSGGCFGKARAQIFGRDGLEPDFQYMLAYHQNSFALASRDSAVVQAMGAWSKCMKEFGHTYKDMWEVNNDRKWQTVKPTSREKRVAQEDVTCKRGSKVLAVLLNVETALQKEYIEKNSDRFAEVRKYREGVEQRTARVMSDG